jgi:glucosyl-3-phosphoglycerate synthase
MRRHYTPELFQNVLVPVVYGCDFAPALKLAQWLTQDQYITLVGLVGLPEGESLSKAAVPARELRATLETITQNTALHVQTRIIVSYTPWKELQHIAAEERPDLLILAWPCQLEGLKIQPAEAYLNPPCDIAMTCRTPSQPIQKLLVPARGGPYAELALRLALAIQRHTHAATTILHLSTGDSDHAQDAPYRGIEKVVKSLRDEVTHVAARTPNPAETILSHARQADTVIMGATARPDLVGSSIGPVAERLMQEDLPGLVIVRTKRPMSLDIEGEGNGKSAISILVDKWFAENTYHADEFADLKKLCSLKEQQKLKVSLALPALNEEETVGNVIHTLKSQLYDEVPLLDEIVLIDSNSNDRTREIAAELGIPVHIHQQIIPQYGARRGKGEALWKSLYATSGDIVIWIDTDIINISSSFVYGLLGPLLTRPKIQFVKGFYQRPLRIGDKVQAGGGGRVTELTARPLLNLFYPELSGVVQPLSGEYGGRRSALERLGFFSGYGVEIGLLIDVLEKFGLSAIAQVDLQERIHRNQSLEALSKMSFAIIQAVMRKLEHRFERSILEEVNKTMKLIRYEPGRLFLDIEEIAEQERPPMIEIPEYLERINHAAP